MRTCRMFAVLALLTVMTYLAGLGATTPSRALAAQPQASALGTGGAPVNLAPAASIDNAWLPLGAGLNSEVDVIVPDGDNLYVGGNFSSAGTIDGADHIARWNGSFWQALAPGLNNSVMAILVDGSNVYVGGAFTYSLGSGVADHIARLNGSTWQSVGGGLNSHVYALAKIGTDLYVGGSFTNAGGITGASYIARWDGSAWHAVGNGLNGSVLGLAVIGTTLYASGIFTGAGVDPNANHIARLNGSTWQALGSGLNDHTGTVVANGTDLYAGGNFTNAGGVSGANFIARWDGGAWHAIGGNPPPGISSIGFAGTNIYVASFHPYRWDGSTWQDLAPTFTIQPKALAVTKNGVYIGGNFTDLAGNPNADRIALWKAKHLLPDSIVYSRYSAVGPTREIRLVDANGANDQLLFNGTFPRLSPDRNSVAFLRPGVGTYPPNYGNDLWVRNLATGAEQLVFDNNDYLVGFDWMSDNLHIVFDYFEKIYRIHSDGTELEEVVTTGPDHPGYNDAPVYNGWDANRAFAFHNEYVGILTSDKYGGNVTHVTNTLPLDFWPAWSPNGQWIAFLRLPTNNIFGGGNYFKIHPDGSGLTQLTSLSGNSNNHLHGVGTWDSNGDHLVAPGTVNGQTGVYAIATDGSGSIIRIPALYGAQADFVGAVIGDVKNWLYLPALFR